MKFNNAEKPTEMNKAVKASGIIMMVYGIIELVDVVNNFLRVIGARFKPYPEFPFSPVNKMFQEKKYAPYALLFTIVQAVIHFVPGLGIILNRKWGIYYTIGSCSYTMSVTPLFLPMGAIDGAFSTTAITLLLIGNYKDRIVEEKDVVPVPERS